MFSYQWMLWTPSPDTVPLLGLEGLLAEIPRKLKALVVEAYHVPLPYQTRWPKEEWSYPQLPWLPLVPAECIPPTLPHPSLLPPPAISQLRGSLQSLLRSGHTGTLYLAALLKKIKWTCKITSLHYKILHILIYLISKNHGHSDGIPLSLPQCGD